MGNLQEELFSGDMLSSKGRLSKERYFYAQLLTFLVFWGAGSVITTLVFTVVESIVSTIFLYGLLGIIVLTYLTVYFNNNAKRLHDLGRNSTLAIVSLIPIIGIFPLFTMFFKRGMNDDNIYGKNPSLALKPYVKNDIGFGRYWLGIDERIVKKKNRKLYKRTTTVMALVLLVNVTFTLGYVYKYGANENLELIKCAYNQISKK